jgi:hypothetical protein
MWLPAHAVAQLPQCLGLFAVFTQPSAPHSVWPTPQTQSPFMQSSPLFGGHFTPQSPQFAVSMLVLTQTPPQSSPVRHWHLPATHV